MSRADAQPKPEPRPLLLAVPAGRSPTGDARVVAYDNDFDMSGLNGPHAVTGLEIPASSDRGRCP